MLSVLIFAMGLIVGVLIATIFIISLGLISMKLRNPTERLE